jgi:replicative DNA helicase
MVNTLYDNTAEATIIASLIKNPSYLIYAKGLKERNFYNEENAAIFWAIKTLYEQGVSKIDALNLNNIFSTDYAKKSVLEKYGILNLSEYILLSSNLARDTSEEFMIAVKTVNSLSAKRVLQGRLKEWAWKCESPNINFAELNRTITSDLSKIIESYVIDDNVTTFGDNINLVTSYLQRNSNSDGTYGIPTKFKTLSERGIVHDPGELILFSAKRKSGKSIILLNELIDKAMNGVPCIYFDSEMTDTLFYIRLLSSITGIQQNKIRSQAFSPEEQKLVKEANEWIQSVKFQHYFTPRFDREEIKSICDIFKRKYGLGFVVYDYLKATGSNTSENYTQLGNNCDFLKNEIAGEFDIPVLAASQLNRFGEIGDSYQLEQRASTGISMRFKTEEEIRLDGGIDYGNAYLHIDFARNAEPMDDMEHINISIDGSRCRVVEAKQKDENPFVN